MQKNNFEILSPALLKEYEKIISGSLLEKYLQYYFKALPFLLMLPQSLLMKKQNNIV
jgi:hypothetical protein